MAKLLSRDRCGSETSEMSLASRAYCARGSLRGSRLSGVSPEFLRRAMASARASDSVSPRSSAAAYASSRCAASSLIVAGERSMRESRACSAMNPRQSAQAGALAPASWPPPASLRRSSGVFHPRDLSEDADEPCPVLTLRGEHFPACVGNPVMPPAPLPRLFDPAARDPAARLHAVKRRVQRRQRERQHAAGSKLDLAANFVPMQAVVFDEGQNQELGGAPLGLVKCRATLASRECRAVGHMKRHDISRPRQ